MADQDQERARRLAEALRQNLRKRKAQARQLSSDEKPDRRAERDREPEV